MDVDPLSRLIGRIRSEVSSRAERGRKGRQAERAPGASQQTRPTVEELRSGTRAALAGLELSAIGHKRQARKIFVGSVLLSEFGAALANDPRFLELVNGVESALSEEPALCAELDSLITELAA